MKLFFSIGLFFILNNLFSQQNITICDENQTTFTYSTETNQVGSYYWYVDGVEQNTNNSLLIINWVNYTYGVHNIEVWFDSEFNCQSSFVSYTVTTIECDNSTMYAPNAFTPDGDRHNNVWLPIGYNWKEIHYIIYNRWGELIFESRDINIGWDGRYKGEDCPDGVYVFVLNWKDNKNIKNTKYGHICLIR